MRFEIMRLDDVDGTAVDSTVVDAASVNRIVQQAAAIGQRTLDPPGRHVRLRNADVTAPVERRRSEPPYGIGCRTGALRVSGGSAASGALDRPG